MSFDIGTDKFILSIVITVCIALAGCACSLVLTGSSSASAKRSFLYMMLYVFIHEIFTLLAFYTTSPDKFRLLVMIKLSSAYLAKTSLLIFAGFYTEKLWIERLSLIVHLLSIGQMVPLFFNERLANAIILFDQPFEVQYGRDALWYMNLPGMLCILISIIVKLSYKPIRRKPLASSVFFGFLLMCIGGLSVNYVTRYDLTRDKMHLIILLGVLAANLRAMPFIDRKNKYLFHPGILEGLPGAVIIYDRKGRVVHIHDGLSAVKISDRLAEIHRQLMDASVSGSLTEGRIALNSQHPVHLQYSISTIQSEKKIYGRIIHFRDVTKMVNLHLELEDKKKQLELAFARKRQMMKAASQLAVENERARILDKVNATANAYIDRVRRDVAQLEAETASGSDLKQKVKAKNDQLLEVTRRVIEEIRATVKK